MQSKQVKPNSWVQHFDSIEQFYRYICETPYNAAFSEQSDRRSGTVSYERTRFTKTKTFDEAVTLMKDGWTDMASELTVRLQNVDKHTQTAHTRQMFNSVAGFQPIVPLYLVGVPTSMASMKMVAKKQKVITVTKLVNYSCGVSSDQIVTESIKAMQVIKALEAQGYRVNIDVALGTQAGGRQIVASIRIKNANEKLNVSKLAFPLVHPSMLRRLLLRYLEVNENVTSAFVFGYGAPISDYTMRPLLPDTIVIPPIWQVDPNDIKSLDDIK